MARLERLVVQGFKSFKRKTSIPFPTGFSVITGPNGGGKCVTGDTLVQLADGSIKRMDELVEEKVRTNPTKELDDGYAAKGDSTQIISLNPDTMRTEAKKVDAFIKRTSPEELIRIRTRSGREITATEYHPLFILEDGEIRGIRADELREGTRIAVPRSLSIKQEAGNFHELVGLIGEEDRIYVPYDESYREALLNKKRSLGITWQELAKRIEVPEESFHGLMNRQSVNFAHLVKMLYFLGFDQDSIARSIPYVKSRIGNKRCKMVWKNSPEFARFLGYNLAEGRLSTTSYQLWFTNGTQEIVEDYVNLVRNLFEINATVNEYSSNCWDVITYSHPLMKIMSKFGMPYGGAGEKRVSGLFLSRCSESELSNFLDGLYSGDGYVSDRRVELVTKSPELASAVTTMLLRLGILTHTRKIVKVATNTGFSGVYYSLTIYGIDNCKGFSNHVRLTHNAKRERLLRICKKPWATNPNIDLIEANSLVKQVSSDLGINVKTSKKRFPRIDAYVYDQCLPSRYGISHLIENLFLPAQRGGKDSDFLVLLKKLSRSDILWDEIIDLERVDSQEKWVYDLTVRDNHNFIANNFFVHNSNLGDAIHFVLGKSSSRALRAKKAHELVFHGSPRKPGSDHAKVALYFDNSAKTLPLEEPSVSISRRISKKGVSTYRMNGKVVTRQQIVDMFALAGISADGHNIIQQGDVNKIVEMDAEQRRKVIDEVSGIAEFDEKKAKAEKELAKIEERVREAEILINEKAGIMEKLKAERDAALRYRELESELSRVRAALIWKDYSGTRKSMEGLGKELEQKEAELAKLEEEIKAYDSDLEQKERQLEELTRSVLKSGDKVEATRRIESLRGEIERKRDRIESNQRELERLDSIIEKITSLDPGSNPALEAVKSFPGVQGSLSDLIMVPPEYNIAVEVAAGSHLRDIVVDSTGNAVKCVKHLKQNRIGRARFLPMDKVKGLPKKPLPTGAVGWLSELIQHDPLHDGIVNYVFSKTAVVKDIDRAKAIAKSERVRMVTLDGDLMEASGAITGGYYRKRSKAGSEAGRYQDEKAKLKNEIESLEKELKGMNMDLEILAEKEKATRTTDLERERVSIDEGLKKAREARKVSYERMLVLQQEIGKLNISKARHEARFDNLKLQWEQRPEKGKEDKVPKELEELARTGAARLKDMEREAIVGIQNLGPINLKAVEDFETLRTEFEDFKQKVDRILEEKEAIVRTVSRIEEKRLETFNKCLGSVSRNFKEVYRELTGGEAELVLEDPRDLGSGLLIKAQPKGKRLLNIDSLSGGEKTLTAFTFLFAIQRYRPSPFYILDEADAALDKSNTKKVAALIRKQCEMAQFIVISHNDALVGEADQVYGVSMEDGESKVIGIELPENSSPKSANN